jgi:hypothetical protein
LTKLIAVLKRATTQFQGNCYASGDNIQTSPGRKSDDGKEKANARGCGNFDGLRKGASQPLTKTKDGQSDEDETFNKDGSEGKIVAH